MSVDRVHGVVAVWALEKRRAFALHLGVGPVLA
jgi:hypothetical protein